jgi:hypothetical protein
MPPEPDIPLDPDMPLPLAGLGLPGVAGALPDVPLVTPAPGPVCAPEPPGRSGFWVPLPSPRLRVPDVLVELLELLMPEPELPGIALELLLPEAPPDMPVEPVCAAAIPVPRASATPTMIFLEVRSLFMIFPSLIGELSTASAMPIISCRNTAAAGYCVSGSTYRFNVDLST